MVHRGFISAVIVSLMVEQRGKQAAGEKQGRKPWTLREFGGKPVWDWMDLLIVPLALVVISLLFSLLQDAQQQWQAARQQQIENQRQDQAQAIENQRAEAELELAEQRAQDEALQAYLAQMSQLILDRKLLEAEPGDPVYTLAQARTSTAILRLDAEHNESVTRFLINSGLAGRSEGSTGLLRGITLSHAKLSGAFLPNADLRDADLSGADLSNAVLVSAYLPGGLANNADLRGAVMTRADLRGLALRNANFSGADLDGARLTGAVLSGTEGITNEELEQQTASLTGAIMPNGQTYEEWLKDKKGREEAG